MDSKKIVLQVNEHADRVEFRFRYHTGYMDYIFSAMDQNPAYHIHSHGVWQTRIKMKYTVTGYAGYPKNAVLFCKKCGLRVVLPYDRFKKEELSFLFKEFRTIGLVETT